MQDVDVVPLSFPAVLRNPRLSDRFAHLHIASEPDPARQHRALKKDRPEPEGKRWVRRRENAKFTHNPHIALPSTLDLAHPLQVPASTFPHPLPSYLPRTVHVPPARPPPTLLSTSSAGLFSLSLRGARRALRARPTSAHLVQAVETHLAAWLQGGTYLNPDETKGLLRFPGDPVGGREDVREVGREAGRLVWAVKADPAVESSPGYGDGGFERYVVHCVARWHGVVSFSKETDGYRLTYLLRPNVKHPDPRTNATSRALDTPPVTDASDFHASDVNPSDFNATSDDNPTDASDIDSVAGDLHARALSDIDESRPSSPDSWFVLGGSDGAIDSDKDVDDHGFAASMESLSLSTHADEEGVADTTLTPSRLQNVPATGLEANEQAPSRSRADWDHLRRLHPRSASSPSPVGRSPHRSSTARRLAARRKRRVKSDKTGFAGALGASKQTFYDYLFA